MKNSKTNGIVYKGNINFLSIKYPVAKNKLFFILKKVLMLMSLLFPLIFAHAAATQTYDVIACVLYNQEGQPVRKTPGHSCLYLNDGSTISNSISGHSLTYFSADQSVVWEREVQTHHEIALNNDKSEILVMDSSYHEYQGRIIRFDALSVFNLKGERIKHFDFFDHLKKLKWYLPEKEQRSLSSLETFDKGWMPDQVAAEFSHANSFYQIPNNLSTFKNSVFASTNYIVNVNWLGVMIVLNSSLTEILWQSQGPLPKNHIPMRHDVQMMESGKLLIYNNYSPHSTVGHSNVEYWDPVSGEQEVIYGGSPPYTFWAPICGGAQILPGLTLVTDNTFGGRVLEVENISGSVIRSYFIPEIDPQTGQPPIIQQARRLDLTDYLKNNRSL